MKPSPLDDPRLTSFGRLVEVHGRVGRLVGASLEEKHGLHVSLFEALLRIGRSPDHRLMMRELAEQLALSTGGATRLVDRLIEAGYARRVACPNDRRVQHVELTPKGRSKLECTVVDHLEELQREYFDRLESAEVVELDRLLDKLRFPAD